MDLPPLPPLIPATNQKKYEVILQLLGIHYAVPAQSLHLEVDPIQLHKQRGRI